MMGSCLMGLGDLKLHVVPHVTSGEKLCFRAGNCTLRHSNIPGSPGGLFFQWSLTSRDIVREQALHFSYTMPL